MNQFTIYFARRLEIRVPRSHTSFFCFLFLTFSVHICDHNGDVMLRAFVYVRTGLVKKRSQSLICSTESAPAACRHVTSMFFYLHVEVCQWNFSRKIYLKPLKSLIMLLLKNELQVRIEVKCFWNNFWKYSRQYYQ